MAAKRIITIYVKVINEGQMETVQNYVNNYKCNVSYFDEAINYWNCNVYVKESVFRQSLWWKGYDIMSFKINQLKRDLTLFGYASEIESENQRSNTLQAKLFVFWIATS